MIYVYKNFFSITHQLLFFSTYRSADQMKIETTHLEDVNITAHFKVFSRFISLFLIFSKDHENKIMKNFHFMLKKFSV